MEEENMSTPHGPADLARLADECALKLQLHEAGYAVREVVPPATTLFDPMLGWVDPDGSLVFGDIGGQLRPGWDPEVGHGSIWRLHRDDRLEAVLPPGAIGRGMVMFPMRAPATFGGHAGEIFFLGQLRPGRAGAHHTHAVYWVPPGSQFCEPFAIVPNAGRIGGGVPGALCPAGWGATGSPEEGTLFVTSLMACTLYAVTPDRRIETWLICDEEHAGVQFMPRQVLRASAEWGEHAGALIVVGQPDTSFEKPAEMTSQPRTAFYRIDEVNGTRRATAVNPPETVATSLALAGAAVAPEGFGPLAGRHFLCTPGSANLAHATKMGEGPLPYDAEILSITEDGRRVPFASQVQSGHPHIMFQGDRLILAIVRKSYSTGEYHEPDGSLYEITYTGPRG
jgi:hypothetical protein